eukprot:gene8766-6167_t
MCVGKRKFLRSSMTCWAFCLFRFRFFPSFFFFFLKYEPTDRYPTAIQFNTNTGRFSSQWATRKENSNTIGSAPLPSAPRELTTFLNGFHAYGILLLLFLV